MDDKQSFRPYLIPAVVMASIGWIGLIILFMVTLPTLWPRWLLFCLLILALTGTALPVTWFINLRFPSNPLAEPFVIVRQAIWVGVYGSTLVWLEMGRILTFGMGLAIGGGVIAIEYLIRVRERSVKPNFKSSDKPEEPPATKTEKENFVG
jgi:hypothetical protein